jgi:hypothetical protein
VGDVHGHDPETCHPCRRDRAASDAMLRDAGGPEPEFWGDRMLREMRERRAVAKGLWCSRCHMVHLSGYCSAVACG